MPSSFDLHVDPARWAGRGVFAIVTIDCDPSQAFAEAREAWRRDPARYERLHFVAVGSLELLESFASEGFSMRVPGLHRREFEDGRVVLTLAIGPADTMLQKLWLRADAFYLHVDAHGTAVPSMCKALARLAGEGATVQATPHPLLRRSLENAGFVCEDGDPVRARFAPRWRVRRHEPPCATDVASREAIVIGAGLAGCAVTERLAARGWRVTLIERHDGVARDASGNPAGVFHPIVWRDDSVAARLTRAAFLYALERWSALERLGHDLGRSTQGLLQIADSAHDAHAISAAIARFGYPPDYVVAVNQAEASRLAGIEVSRGGWFFKHGGWISPAAVCAAQCTAAGERLTRRFGTGVARIGRERGAWIAFDANGQPIARAPVLVMANAGDASRLLALHGEPTHSVRGQLTLLEAGPLDALRMPVVGEGYAVPLGANGSHATLAGATYDIDDTDSQLRDDGHAENLERVARMLPALNERKPQVAFDGRVAFRSVTSDRMPMIGALADEAAARANSAAMSGAWPLDLPRAPGLFGTFAFGSRGLVWSALGAELIAAQIQGEPWPIERELAEAIDPARFLLRALRHGELN
jgi:tRNA 5-methylaminomethyl-2-thiouridine biosynthesis bifunctional protein